MARFAEEPRWQLRQHMKLVFGDQHRSDPALLETWTGLRYMLRYFLGQLEKNASVFIRLLTKPESGPDDVSVGDLSNAYDVNVRKFRKKEAPFAFNAGVFRRVFRRAQRRVCRRAQSC